VAVTTVGSPMTTRRKLRCLRQKLHTASMKNDLP
jgi:hypothetical protein